MDQDGFIDVPGGRVWYKIVARERRGVPLLALHGGPGAPHDYLEPLVALADERPVVFYDQLGCGNSETPQDPSLWTLERFLEELVAVRFALRLNRVHILGQSWGSMLAVEYMLTKRPRGVLSLILSGPCLSVPRFASDQRIWLADLPEDQRRTIEECEGKGDYENEAYQNAMTAYYRSHVCRLEPWPDCMNRTIEKFGYAVYRHMWGPSEFTVTGTLKDYDRVWRLHEISVPTLLTCGEYDECTPQAAREYQRHMPGAEIMVFEGASHEHHLEQPEEFIARVRIFLRTAE